MTPAECSDAFALAALEIQRHREHGCVGEPGFLDRYADAWLAERERRPSWLAKTLDGRPVSAVMLHLVSPLPKPGRVGRPWAHLTTLYVSRDARRSGVGESLVHAALDWCSDRHVLWIQLSSNVTAAGLYRRAGFRPVGDRLLYLAPHERLTPP
ncbi:GNAT family N-acetyltransferase [Austwickia sp. TVS 96-490-7B]|uniref:GNAT family N-acetyltransferase n=1 Tax=Austwickia sp. TVS 96-490-7B TaxID=2830843 RepID=UPI001C55E46F|nr:GNAT family N-acetyltransferase [Austwickia sp. TVS 96-490-7B]